MKTTLNNRENDEPFEIICSVRLRVRTYSFQG
jgi:hypothetical protein